MTTFASPHWLTDEQLAQLNIDPLVTSEFRSYHYQQSFGIEVWYDQLKEHTFQTSFLPLSLDEVKAIVEAHNTKNLNFSQNDVLQNLSNKIQAEIEKRGNRGVFIKLNTRSPKDVCIDSIDDPENVDKLLEWVEDDLLNSNKTRKELEHNFTGDEIIRSFTKACTKSMKISNSTEALSTLIKSSNQLVKYDNKTWWNSFDLLNDVIDINQKRLEDSILFFLNVDMSFDVNFASIIRNRVFAGKQVFSPACYSYHHNGQPPLLENGFYRDSASGNIGIYASDFVHHPWYKHDDTHWGKEDDNYFNLLRKSFIVYRTYEPNFYHLYHPDRPWKTI